MAAAEATRATEIQAARATQLRAWRGDDLEHGRSHDLRVFALTRDTVPNAD